MKFSINVLLLFVIACITACSNDPTNPGNIDIPPEFECKDGLSDDTYECQNIGLVATLSPEDLMADPLDDGRALNDIWGWTDPQTGIEYAIVGLVDGVAFVSLFDPVNPKVIGKLEETDAVSEKANKRSYSPSLMHDEKSTWRDFKVFQNHLYVVSDGQPHGMQIFDLTHLRDVENGPEIFEEDYLYDDIENAHNIAINEESGFAYVVGSNTFGGGLHILNLQNPVDPTFAGFHSDSTVGYDSTGYVHDAQCVTYSGPDSDYQGAEICMNSSENYLVIADVSDKDRTETIAKATYENNGYAHQGWLTEDHRYFLLDDEFDEAQRELNTQTYIWDVQDLDNPKLIGVFESTERSIDHNQYIKGKYVYQANYTSGLRILSFDDIVNGLLEEVAYFDTDPEKDSQSFDGAWSNYPFFDSGLVIVSDINQGLFILEPELK